nr:transposase [Endozoicomonas sp. ONNA2]
MKHLDERVEKLGQKLETIAFNNEACQPLLTIPGIGLLSATALVVAIGDISAFKKLGSGL